jgi:hypothetical protein
MNEPNDGGPAFPTENVHQTGPNSYHYPGMSLRDYFAAKAMQACVARWFSVIDEIMVEDPRSPLLNKPRSHGIERCAITAYQYADAMLTAREKGVK